MTVCDYFIDYRLTTLIMRQPSITHQQPCEAHLITLQEVCFFKPGVINSREQQGAIIEMPSLTSMDFV